MLSKRASVRAQTSRADIGRNLEQSLGVLLKAVGVLKHSLDDCLGADHHLRVTLVGIRVQQIAELLVHVDHRRAGLESIEVVHLFIWIQAQSHHCNFSRILTAFQQIFRIRGQRLSILIFLHILIFAVLFFFVDPGGDILCFPISPLNLTSNSSAILITPFFCNSL